MKEEEAVSTVVAMMLILAILSTLIAIYTATYLPGLKQQAEIEHSHDVADAFARFGSDIDYAVSHKTGARFSEPFALGGGDVLLSPVRSSGTVTIENQTLVKVTITGKETKKKAASLVNISYVPSFTTWEPQGYRWEYGFVAVTKGDVAVPQSSNYNTMDEARNDSQAFLRSFVDMTDSDNTIEITLVNLTAENGRSDITGSGIATLKLNATAIVPVVLPDVTKIEFEDLTAGSQAPEMGNSLKQICNDVVNTTPGATYVPNGPFHNLTFTPPTTVTLRTLEIEVSAC